MSTETWKLEKDLCRCCHSEGNFKNLAVPCKVSGLAEIYSDMLKDCFDINLTPVPGTLCAMTYTICEACISRLRDATDFKKQVQSCEERFRNMYNRNVIKVDTSINLDVKEELPDVYQDDDFKEECSQDDIDDEDYDEPIKYKYDEEDDESDSKEEGRTKKKKIKSKKSEKIKSSKTAGKSKKMNQEETGDKNENKKKDYATETATYYTLERQEDGTNNYTCTSCTKAYKSLASVVQHYRHVHLHLRPKLRSCFYCEIRVPGHVRAFHLEKEHGIPAPTCGACGKKFAYPFQVLRHQKNDHMGEKTFSCSECHMKFTSQANLTQHAIKHSPVREHKCGFCEKSFKWKKNLRTHIMMHMDERRHVCCVCQEAFVQQTSLKYHITKRHPEMV